MPVSLPLLKGFGQAVGDPREDMADEGAGLVPGGEEEGKMRMHRRFDSVASLP
jgi:hypothetical protein